MWLDATIRTTQFHNVTSKGNKLPAAIIVTIYNLLITIYNCKRINKSKAHCAHSALILVIFLPKLIVVLKNEKIVSSIVEPKNCRHSNIVLCNFFVGFVIFFVLRPKQKSSDTMGSFLVKPIEKPNAVIFSFKNWNIKHFLKGFLQDLCIMIVYCSLGQSPIRLGSFLVKPIVKPNAVIL